MSSNTLVSANKSTQNFANNEEMFRYKAKKYHYKCQAKLAELQAANKPVPAGYEKYLKPFE
jgi:hypothetical protein